MTALITGAASGIGKAIAQRLERNGTAVIGWDVAWTHADEFHVAVDVTDEESVAAGALLLPRRLDAVIACAGISSRTALVDTPLDEFRRVIDVNLVGTAAVAQHTHGRLGGGVFIAIGSVAASVPMARRAAYCASKAGVVMLAKVLGSEWAQDDIQVLAISPGFADTGMATSGGSTGATNLDIVLDRTPTHTLVATSDLLDVIELAASGRLSGMTGSEIVVDNGFVSGTRL